ncbi:unnamed protein product [Closterium sp. NIES-65]|nr:unnamed protein product [Closterium sp. NIES-65]
MTRPQLTFLLHRTTVKSLPIRLVPLTRHRLGASDSGPRAASELRDPGLRAPCFRAVNISPSPFLYFWQRWQPQACLCYLTLAYLQMPPLFPSRARAPSPYDAARNPSPGAASSPSGGSLRLPHLLPSLPHPALAPPLCPSG